LQGFDWLYPNMIVLSFWKVDWKAWMGNCNNLNASLVWTL
jgi:hypothetical protein